MSSDDPTPTSPTPRPRRASFAAGQSLADLFRSAPRSPPMPSPPSNTTTNTTTSTTTPSFASNPITTAATAAATSHPSSRRLSVTTLGLSLSGSPNQSSPFGGLRSRRGSLSSATSNSIDETAVVDDGGSAVQQDAGGGGGVPNTPFARRMSFGARALRDRQSSSGGGAVGAGGAGAGSPGSNNGTGRASLALNMSPASPPLPPLPISGGGSVGGDKPLGAISPPTAAAAAASARGRGSEGFSWSDNLRTRAERSSLQFGGAAGGGIFGGAGGGAAGGGVGGGMGAGGLGAGGAGVGGGHQKAKSVAAVETTQMPSPAVAVGGKTPVVKKQKAPDRFQERILKGDFYMD